MPWGSQTAIQREHIQTKSQHQLPSIRWKAFRCVQPQTSGHLQAWGNPRWLRCDRYKLSLPSSYILQLCEEKLMSAIIWSHWIWVLFIQPQVLLLYFSKAFLRSSVTYSNLNFKSIALRIMNVSFQINQQYTDGHLNCFQSFASANNS